MAASSSLALEQSTKEIFNPNSVATCLKYLFVPEAEENQNQIKWKEYFIKKCSFLIGMNTYKEVSIINKNTTKTNSTSVK